MDFELDESQEAVRDLAAQIFAGRATVERVKEVEAGDDRFDRQLWAELAGANLLGLPLPDEHGGSGLGLVEVCLLLEQQGRRVAPVPLLPTLTAAMAIAEHGREDQRRRWLPSVVAGDVVLTAALEGSTDDVVVDGDRLHGTKPSVPAAHLAGAILVPTPEGLFLVDPAAEGVTIERADTTDHQPVGHVGLDGPPAEALGDGGVGPGWLRERMLVGLCAVAVGVAEEAVRMAADYTSQREQFGRPLSTFQGTALKAADAYIDTEAMRATTWQAAWRLTEGLDATREVLVAKWWASDAGQRVVHATQHMHGGVGADVDYPVHRYFLWGKQIADTLGGASETLALLGRELAAP